MSRHPEANDTNNKIGSGLLDLPFPIVVDGDDNKVKQAYAGWPIRLYWWSINKARLPLTGAKG